MPPIFGDQTISKCNLLLVIEPSGKIVWLVSAIYNIMHAHDQLCWIVFVSCSAQLSAFDCTV